MKRAVTALFAVLFLLNMSGCGNADFSGGSAASSGPAGSSSSLESSPVSSQESSTAHEAEPVPKSTPRPEAVAGDGGDFDLLASSPAYPGQEELLQDICSMSTRKPPESFLWLDEETVRSAWGIEGSISAGCRDFVARFDFGRSGEDGQWEDFSVWIALFPGVDLPEPDGSETGSKADWVPVEGHSGFESMETQDAAVRVRWQADGLWIMAQLPKSGLEAFWQSADALLSPVNAADAEPGGDWGTASVGSVGEG